MAGMADVTSQPHLPHRSPRSPLWRVSGSTPSVALLLAGVALRVSATTGSGLAEVLVGGNVTTTDDRFLDGVPRSGLGWIVVAFGPFQRLAQLIAGEGASRRAFPRIPTGADQPAPGRPPRSRRGAGSPRALRGPLTPRTALCPSCGEPVARRRAAERTKSRGLEVR